MGFAKPSDRKERSNRQAVCSSGADRFLHVPREKEQLEQGRHKLAAVAVQFTESSVTRRFRCMQLAVKLLGQLQSGAATQRLSGPQGPVRSRLLLGWVPFNRDDSEVQRIAFRLHDAFHSDLLSLLSSTLDVAGLGLIAGSHL